MKYNFYYDESEHSRSIGFKTVTVENFYDNFITVIVGWKSQNEQKIQEQYCDFEQKYIDRHPDKELKNKTIQPKQLRYGFASTAKGNIAFFDDFLKLFSNDVYIYIEIIMYYRLLYCSLREVHYSSLCYSVRKKQIFLDHIITKALHQINGFYI